jgi:precorrin-3B synthase
MAPHRRGACPGLTTPMLTGDGLLVRLQPTDSIAVGAFEKLCEAARHHGNGTIEISARGSLQVRGLSAQSASAFADAIGALGIPAADGLSVTTDPLADDPAVLIDATGLANTLRRRIAQARLSVGVPFGEIERHRAAVSVCSLPPCGGGLGRGVVAGDSSPTPTPNASPQGGGEFILSNALAPKVCVVVDGGGRLHLDALAADVRLRAFGSREAPRLHVSVGGDAAAAMSLGSIALKQAPHLALRLLRVIASHGGNARAADILHIDGGEPFRAAVAGQVEPAPELPRRGPTDVIGSHPLRDGSVALGVALAFGHAHADALAQLACDAREHGVHSIRLVPGRALLLLPVAPENAAALSGEAAQLGFVVRCDDPRRRIVACPGKPACASGWIPARAIAAEIAQHLSPVGATVHISGCAKGCAHPRAAELTLVGSERGCGIIHHGSARDVPGTCVGSGDIVSAIIACEGEAAHV